MSDNNKVIDIRRSWGGVSPNLRYLESSATLRISQEAKRRKEAGEDVIDLSAGEPDFPTPRLAAEAGIKAIQDGLTGYPPNAGIADLRTGVARSMSLMSGGRPVNPDNIVISNGAKQSLFNACFTLFGPGDKVLIPSPAWVSYPQMVHLSRAEPVEVQGDPEWSMKVSVRDLEEAADKAVRGIILCSPSNPTGAVYASSELKAIAEWASDHSIWIISDEIYRKIHYGNGPAPSMLDLSDELLEHTVVIYGASKAYSMTGWRIGAALAPREIARSMAAFQSHTTSGASHPAQWAAAEAFSSDKVDKEVDKMVTRFRERRDMVVSFFRDRLPGVEFVEPLGAFYFFFRVDRFFGEHFDSALGFCESLMTDQGLALVPGDAFGDKRWVRLSYASSESQIKKGLERIEKFVAGR